MIADFSLNSTLFIFIPLVRHFNYKRKMSNMSAISRNDPAVYRNLFNTIKQEITKTRDELQKQKAVCYWKIGTHIPKTGRALTIELDKLQRSSECVGSIFHRDSLHLIIEVQPR